MSWTARALAALALVGAAIVLVVVVSNGVSKIDSGNDTDQQTQQVDTGCQADDEQAVKDGYYVLDAGEGLSDVASKTCVPVDRLLKLNPNLDPQELPVGGCVDLVTDGCKALASG